MGHHKRQALHIALRIKFSRRDNGRKIACGSPLFRHADDVVIGRDLVDLAALYQIHPIELLGLREVFRRHGIELIVEQISEDLRGFFLLISALLSSSRQVDWSLSGFCMWPE